MSDKQKHLFTPIRLIEDQPIDDLERDFLGLTPLAKMIAAAAVGTPGPFTIGVHGSWGYGKTTLLKLAQALIEVNHKDIVTVWFNAWQFEREEHPLFPLIAAIADEIERKAGPAQEAHTGLGKIGLSLRALTRGMKFTGEIGMPLVGKVGIEFDADKALKAEELLGKQTNPLQAEMIYHSAFRMLEEAARTKGADAPPKIVVFVDDLDRCQPEKAVFLLESIKLILSQPGFVFVIAADRDVIEGYLERRYIEQCGEQTSDRGKLYMDKIVQLPIHIPSHRSRFAKFVERVVADLRGREDDSEPIKALRNTQTVLATGAGTNPRSLVRLINNFLLDCTLWRLIDHDDEYQDLTEDIASALAFNRILHHELGESLHAHLVNSQELCDAILQDGLGKYAVQERPEELHAMRLGERGPAGDMELIARKLIARPELLAALREHGQGWLEDDKLRCVVNEFAQRERAEAGTTALPEALAPAVRDALALQAEEPIPADRLATILSLDLSNTRVTDADLTYLRPLSQLQELRLTRTRVTGHGLAHLGDFLQLGMLWLNGTQIEDAGLVHLREFPQLRQLSLEDTRVSDSGMVELTRLLQLEWLSLGGTDITDAALAELKELTQLETLYLDKTDVTGAGLEYVSGLTRLQSLVLNSTAVGDGGLEHLEGMSHLQALHLDNAEVTDEGLGHLGGLSELRTLVLSGNEITHVGLAHLKGLAQLQQLSLAATKVTDAGLEHVKGLTQLHTLVLNSTKVGDRGLEHLKGMSRLQALYLDNTKVTDAGLEHLEGLSELRSLVLSGNEIADAGLAHLKGLSQLKLLSLTGTQVTDAGLAHLKDLAQLQGLWLSGLQVTDAGLAHLKGLSQLKLLSLRGTRVTEAGIKTFREEHPGVEIEGR